LGTATGGIMMYSDSLWDSSVLLGVKDVLPVKGQLYIYPNPAKDYFVCAIENTDFINPKTDVFNVLGERIIVESKLSGGKIEVSSINLSPGFYIVKIIDSGTTYTVKVLLSK